MNCRLKARFSIKGIVPEGAHILMEYLEFANVAIGAERRKKGDKGAQEYRALRGKRRRRKRS